MIVFCSIIGLLCFSIDKIEDVSKNNIIYIDPGHGGVDGGAEVDGAREADLNLKISFKLKDIFEEKGYNVLLTRTDDYDLSNGADRRKRADANKRVELINKSDCDLYLSIHMNTFSEEKYRGMQTFYNPNNQNSNILAKCIQDSCINYLQNTTRKEKALKGKYIVDNITKPGCLIECGFLSNKEELSLLLTDEYQTKIAFAIYYGCESYLKNI